MKLQVLKMNSFTRTFLLKFLLKGSVTLFMTFVRTASVNQNCY